MSVLYLLSIWLPIVAAAVPGFQARCPLTTV